MEPPRHLLSSKWMIIARRNIHKQYKQARSNTNKQGPTRSDQNGCRAMAGYALMMASTALQSRCQWVPPYHTHEVNPFRALEHTGSLQD
ncbi:hypothetical protein LR48_Vigan08g118100 [Vigna angularis]|uniref:Uncharacterized protein n=1 Tax=Phaseolus angularis TaxID=3914 RepID=A0A0L9V6Q3_PHAAN|nr:hypothetical protein LR48_Vigan08g118100 [Vigna angularis]